MVAIGIRRALLLGTITLGMFPLAAPASAHVFNYTGAEISYTVPYTGIYNIVALGAQGGSSQFPGGHGAEAGGAFNLSAGETLLIVVGGPGDPSSPGSSGSPGGGGGGGGTFVFGPTALLVSAGGGGGGGGGGFEGALGGAGGGSALGAAGGGQSGGATFICSGSGCTYGAGMGGAGGDGSGGNFAGGVGSTDAFGSGGAGGSGGFGSGGGGGAGAAFPGGVGGGGGGGGIYGGSGGGGGNFAVPPFDIPAGDGSPYLDSSVLPNSAILVPGGNPDAFGEVDVSLIPEPMSLALLGGGFAGLLTLRRRRTMALPHGDT